MRSQIRQAVWDKTRGHCYYCGLALTPDEVGTIEGRYNSWMDTDHLVPKAKGGLDALENMVPSCKACNSSKGHKTVEEYRQHVAIKKSGRPNLSREVVDWLDSVGFQFPALPVHRFWFELHLVSGEQEKTQESAA
ncbi:HNH endonuclease [Rhizobium lentis]|uniref:HNH endonuclease n=1 Tax=Rhizobium lentis TaxID=1138194 RepID=UPI001C83BEB0|nr:HNH endonuclease [Rhizobium lentis]MBX5143357.1 HNH endonuclease [Rhizobium lentis]